MVKICGLTICLEGVSPVANLLTLFIILTSSNECMAYLTSVLFTVVSIIFIVTNPLLCYRI
jgi:hypothetical protein